MNLRFKGKGLFVFSDPGGAKPILALSESLKPDLVSYKIISDRTYSFIDNFAVEVCKPSLSALDELKNYRPDFLFTGTSYTSSIELEYLKAAKELAIQSYSFVDHWTSIRARFNYSGAEIFPDMILVIDERAKQIALNQGIEISRLIIFANPYHQYLEHWKPTISKPEFLRSLGLHGTNKKIALYAPDPLSNIDGSSTFGFDEITATKQLITAVKEIKDSYSFVCKLHPNQKPDSLLSVIGAEMIVAPHEIDVNLLIFHADVVIGFFSNLLIEASVMKKPVIRFFLKKGLKDPFENMPIGKTAYPNTIVQELKAIQ